MLTKTSLALLLGLTLGGAAQAQNCPCNGSGSLITPASALQTLLANKMVCANLGSEQWQEWHNGGASGPVVDYKKGPGDPTDPSETVGSYAIGPNPTVSYTYGSSTYTYAVCQTGNSYTFCGAAFGGRDITGALVATSAGLQACSSVSAASTSKVNRSQR